MTLGGDHRATFSRGTAVPAVTLGGDHRATLLIYIVTQQGVQIHAWRLRAHLARDWAFKPPGNITTVRCIRIMPTYPKRSGLVAPIPKGARRTNRAGKPMGVLGLPQSLSGLCYSALVRSSGQLDATMLSELLLTVDCPRLNTMQLDLNHWRYIQIGGEHEDFYDPDFCIYNDVIVFDGKGSFQIYGYPKDVFPPTDFHTATLVEEHIYVIGSLGYQDERKFGTTPVYRLNLASLAMEALATEGVAPGWIHKHLAKHTPESNAIVISKGEVQVDSSAPTENRATFSLDLSTRHWTKLD